MNAVAGNTTQAEMATMHELVSKDKVEEEALLAQLNKVLSLENEIKRTRLTIAVRIKNTLTTEQKEQLMLIKKRRQNFLPSGEPRRRMRDYYDPIPRP